MKIIAIALLFQFLIFQIVINNGNQLVIREPSDKELIQLCFEQLLFKYSIRYHFIISYFTF